MRARVQRSGWKSAFLSAAGLGGGSSDAAATIIALNRLWNLQLSLTEQRRLAAALGSDVPFFLTGGTALATGRGERITPLPPLPQYWVVLVLLPRVLSTAAVYKRRDPSGTTPQASRPQTPSRQPNAARSRRRPAGITPSPYPAQALAPEITCSTVRHCFKAGAQHAHVSGSGPTVFAVCQEEGAARTLAGRLQEWGHTAEIAPFVQSGWARGEAGA